MLESRSLLAANVAPTLGAPEATALSYAENAVATQITNAITVADLDDTNLESATITIGAGYQIGQDVLAVNGAMLSMWKASMRCSAIGAINRAGAKNSSLSERSSCPKGAKQAGLCRKTTW